MGRMKKTRKFAEVKRLLNPKEAKGVEKGKEKGKGGADKGKGKGKRRRDDEDNEDVRQMYARRGRHARTTRARRGPPGVRAPCARPRGARARRATPRR